VSAARNALVVGAGVFGAAAATELSRRGWRVRLLDPGPIPHPLAGSTDISKLVRADYGSDDDYTNLAAEALPIWREWNAAFGETLFHETGILALTGAPMEERPFERESFLRAERMGFRPERLDARAIAKRFPAFREGRFVDGYLNPVAGWTESGRVVCAMVRRAQAAGVELIEGARVAELLEIGSRIGGVVLEDGTRLTSDMVVAATGQWTPHLLPFTKPFFRSNGMPVWWLKPVDPAPFAEPKLVGFLADISQTGWYGFPVHPIERVVKIANHGEGREMHPESPERVVTAEETARLREFLAGAMPALLDAPIVYTRVCLYCDTRDGHFWIDHDPEREGLVLATGGSGHGLKFAPVLGGIIADVVERKPNPWAWKFVWRTEGRAVNEEEARHKESG
jgi:glycine/D-amino acid oxidase-like deaminating enzyme